MLSSFCYWLDRQGLLPHTLLLTTDEATWRAVHARGLPVFLDAAFPRLLRYQHSVQLRGQGIWNREFDVQVGGWHSASSERICASCWLAPACAVCAAIG